MLQCVVRALNKKFMNQPQRSGFAFEELKRVIVGQRITTEDFPGIIAELKREKTVRQRAGRLWVK